MNASLRRVCGWGVALAALTGCHTQPAVVPQPHYVLGAPYQAAGAWHYPREIYDLDETGLAQVIAADHPALTTNGEAFDQAAMAAAFDAIQLPAIARVTNMETGRAVLVRINDRGTGSRHRVIELTRRATFLLGMADNATARVRVQVLPGPSHDAADAMPNAPRLAVSSAPRAAVEVAELPPPPGTRAGQGHVIAALPMQGAVRIAAAVPLRLPETVTQGRPNPGRLWVRLDSFEDYQYAAALRARVADLGPHITQVTHGRAHRFRVEVGPLDDVRQADAILDGALAADIPDARIVVE